MFDVHVSLGIAVASGAVILIIAIAMSLWIFKEGKINLTKSRAVYGKPAHAIAILMLLYVPISIAIVYLINASGKGVVQQGNKDLVISGIVQVGVCVLLVFVFIAVIIAAIFSESDAAVWQPRKRRPKQESRPRGRKMRWDEIEEQEEERAQRRAERRESSRDYDDDEDDDRRRRRRRD